MMGALWGWAIALCGLLASGSAFAQEKAAPLASAGPAPTEYALSLRDGDYRIRVTLRPGVPEALHLLEINLDIARHREVPDPQYGDLVPLEGAKLAAMVSGPGIRTRHLVRALGDAGSYGLHVTPSEKGYWTIALGPLEPGQAGPTISFQIGVGVPMPPSAQGEAVQSSRTVVSAGRPVIEPGEGTLRPQMQELGERFFSARDAATGAAQAAQESEMAQLARGFEGHAPAALAKSGGEFDALARDTAAALEKAAALARRNRAQGALQLQSIAANECLRCHVKFRDGVVADLAGWPEVSPWRK